MKKALLTLAVVLTSVSVFAQGTIVFNNLGGKAVKWDASAVNYPGGGKTPGNNITAADGILVQLIWLGTDGATPTPVGAPVSAWPLAGTFNGGQREVAAANTSDPGWTWQIQAWSSALGGTDWPAGYDASPVKQVNGQGTIGGVVEFQSKTGDPAASISPQGMAGVIPAFTIGVVPEPSVFALGILGVGALLFLRRRK